MDNTYRVSITWMHGRDGWAEAPGIRESLKFSAPPEFGGRPGYWSPEQLLVMAANSCFLSTFLFFAEKSNILLAGYRAEGEGRLEMVEGKGYQFAEIVLRPVVVLEKEKDMARVQRLLQKAEHACIVAHSLATPIRVESRVEVALPKSA